MKNNNKAKYTKLGYGIKTPYGFILNLTGDVLNQIVNMEPGGQIYLKTFKATNKEGKEFEGSAFEYLTPSQVSENRAKYEARKQQASEESL